MLKNIENFDGWFEVNSYEDIVLGKGELTLKVTSLKTMMEYMPIIQELDKVVNDINSFNKNKLYFYNDRFCFDSINYNEILAKLEEKMNDFHEKLEKNGLKMEKWTINHVDAKYIEDITLCLIQ